MSLLTTLGLGFILGLRHAFDADHLIAVSTIVTREHSVWRSLWIGLSWGVGHTLTLLMIGLVVLGLKIQIPAMLELSLECAVGVVLIGLGLATLYDYRRKKLHAHSHTHVEPAQGEAVHMHFHAHKESPAHEHAHPLRVGLRPLLLGMVHGLAGSAALMLLVLATIPSPTWGLGYIVVFGGGSILGMGLVSLVMGLCVSWVADWLQALNQGVRLAVGTLSTAFGVWMVIEIGFIQGLFLG